MKVCYQKLLIELCVGISELPMKFWKPSEGDGSIEIQTAQSTLTLSKTSITSNQTFPSRVDSSADPCIT